MKSIVITTIPHSQQRYNTVGDWVDTETTLAITISDLGNPDAEFLCAMHELTEAWLARRHGITQEQVDAYDLASTSEDPGCESDSPYHREHEAGEVIERVLCGLAGMDFHEYERAFDAVG